jgi:hypothetical protein
VLFSDVSHRHVFAFAVANGQPEDALCQKDAFRVVAQSSMQRERVGSGEPTSSRLCSRN